MRRVSAISGGDSEKFGGAGGAEGGEKRSPLDASDGLMYLSGPRARTAGLLPGLAA
jgi:hypothetical protein